jgi:hypothetical protein
VLALWDQFAEEVKRANLMGSLQMPKRGSFKIWNVDGMLQGQIPANTAQETWKAAVFGKLRRLLSR